MLSPSRLLFGTPDPDPLCDEKPIWLDRVDGVPGLGWQDSDTADDRNTDVPHGALTADERSVEIEASWNESEEERRSPQGPAFADAGGLYAETPALGLPPGLPLLGAGAPADESDEEDADDEMSGGSRHSGDAIAAAGGPPGLFAGGGGGDLRVYSELPSIGSVNHFSGTCDRCCFHPKGRCLNGFNCQHCHFDHEKRKRKNKKKGKADGRSLLAGDSPAPSASSTPGASAVSAAASAAGGSPSVSLWSLKASLEDASRERPREQPREAPERALEGLPSPLATSPELRLNASGADYVASSAPAPPPTLPPRFQAAPGVAAQPLTPQPGAAGPPGYMAPPGPLSSGMPQQFDFLTLPAPGPCHQVPAPLLSRGDVSTGASVRMELEAYGERREEYVRQLEAENRYLRGLLTQYVGPQAFGAAPGHCGAGSCAPAGGLSPSAAPFWPSTAGAGAMHDLVAGAV